MSKPSHWLWRTVKDTMCADMMKKDGMKKDGMKKDDAMMKKDEPMKK